MSVWDPGWILLGSDGVRLGAAEKLMESWDVLKSGHEANHVPVINALTTAVSLLPLLDDGSQMISCLYR